MYAISSFPLLVLFLASFVTGRARLQCFPTSVIILCAQFTNKFSYDSDELDAGRTLNAANTVNGTSMTIEFCIQFCDTGGFIYAGTEFGVSAHPLLPPPPHLFSLTPLSTAMPYMSSIHHLGYRPHY